MQVIPVIDLLGHQVVRGVAGNRSAYRPIVSQLSDSAEPQQIAQAFVDRFRCQQLYVADLDAIGGRVCDWESVLEIGRAGARIMIDAGVRASAKAKELVDYDRTHDSFCGIVVALESVAGPNDLVAISGVIDRAQKVFSLDLKQGALLSESRGWGAWSPRDIVARAVDEEFERIIVLDLSDVGTRGGTSTLSLCRELRRDFPTIELIAGGGVRGFQDLEQLADAGCDAALVASALHDGGLSRSDVELAQTLSR